MTGKSILAEYQDNAVEATVELLLSLPPAIQSQKRDLLERPMQRHGLVSRVLHCSLYYPRCDQSKGCQSRTNLTDGIPYFRSDSVRVLAR